MSSQSKIGGILAASITPIKPDGKPDYAAIPSYLDFLVQRGCHGALILGTTGEGPSFSVIERKRIYRSALEIHQKHPDFILLAGTGTPSLDESIQLTRYVFDLGFDGVVVLPPYFFHSVSEDGIFAWFDTLIQKAVAPFGKLFYYHIPQLTGISLSLNLLQRLLDHHPTKFGGLKDSSSDAAFAQILGDRFGNALSVFTGQDRLLGWALSNNAAGCITAGANLFSSWLRQIWDAHQQGITLENLENDIKAARTIMDQNPPASAFIKGILPTLFSFPAWTVRPPILPYSPERLHQAIQQLTNDLLLPTP